MQEIFRFLEALRENNDRDWFHANKEWYLRIKAEHEAFINRVIAALAVVEPEVEGLEAKDCIFRIYRDTRFSPNKQPYKTHIGAYMVRGGKKSPRSGYYVHIEPGNCLLAGGVWCPEPSLLKALRQDVYDNIDEFTDIVRDKEFAKYYRLDGEKLKKVPAPFPKDFPEAEMLKFKAYTVTHGVPDAFFEGEDAVERVVDRLLLMKPFHRFLNYTVEETWNN
ncbi:DUF2461 domain-containing protein [Butyricimonas muris]|uniref:DUF2461 domain-containing protein n=1 Tax=Butyricimonas muris TaxID=3378067 RepID=UPI003966FE84